MLKRTLKALGWLPAIQGYIDRAFQRALVPTLVDGSAGRIGTPVSDRIPVYLAHPWSEQPPLLMIDGFPVEVSQNRAEASGKLPQSLESLQLRASGARAGSWAELFGFANGTFSRLDQMALKASVIETGFLSQLDRAVSISRQPGAVAITCWDGAHNPIGRAKVLYDVVGRKRPAIIVSYLFKEFGGRLWQPILNESCAVLTIPWERRQVYEEAIRRSGIRFDTVWICKPRLPSFLLAALVATPQARMILDFDDNEEEFSLSAGAEATFFGRMTINLARKLIDTVPARTVASRSLQEFFGGHLVRHARDAFTDATEPAPKTPGAPIKVGFIGTVRQHKRILEAASAIARFGQSRGLPVQFHVFGDVSPPRLASDLRKLGAIVKPNVPMHRLNTVQTKFDIVLAGFPSNDPKDRKINRFQISSKIGDALAVRRPVLVPESPSTSDLASIEGVFLFDSASFEARLQDAIDFRGKIDLPEAFTIDGAYASFATAEADANTGSGAVGLRALLADGSFGHDTRIPLRPTLLLIWKQHDGGLFGRRIDQIARSYRRQHPDHDVVILELISSSKLMEIESAAKAFHAEWHHVFDLADKKRAGLTDAEGVRMQQLHWTAKDGLPQALEHFLLTQGFLPQNTVVVLFPIINDLEKIMPILKAYQRLVDIVDNQLCWSGQNAPLAIMRQYLMLTRSSDAIVFNSAANRDYFQQNAFLPSEVPIHVIPNWYQLPIGIPTGQTAPDRNPNVQQIAYTGNMRNRFDFELVIRLAQRIPEVTIHLIGAMHITDPAATRAMKMPNVVYHGPRPERATLELLCQMDLAIVPHSLDAVSAYMDPLKVEMYESIGLRTVATNMPGIDNTDLISVATSDDDFINLVIAQLALRPDRSAVFHDQDRPDAYGRLVSRLMDRALAKQHATEKSE